jgi:ATP-binding cassette subfamily C (CFTR/MRP) protein 1
MDITRIPRNDIRDRLICVPQDALLLPGTFRFNLDPESNIIPTASLETVLKKVGLWELVIERGGLNGEVDPNSISHGEQQLLAFARAILRKDMLDGKCILILDEATSSMDEDAQQLVYELVRQEFNENTVISVARRMNALKDVDLVIELEKGTILQS